MVPSFRELYREYIVTFDETGAISGSRP